MTATADMEHDATATASVTGFTVRLTGALGVVFLVAGTGLLVAAYAGVAWPTRFEGWSLGEYLAYGRAMPMALNALVFGWVTLGLIAALYHFVPRLVGGPLALPGAALGSVALIGAGVVSGVVAIGVGAGAGGYLLEMPWYSDLLVLAGSLTTAVVVSTTVRHGEAERVGVPVWYAVAAPWWLFLSYAVGAIPGLTGIDAGLQSAFSATAVVGMWAVAASIGVGYALVADVTADATFHPRLGRIGFWSIGLLWAWTAARTLQYGPTADWLETIPVLFGIGLVVAAIAVATDLAMAVRGRLDSVTRSTSLGLYAVGTVLFLLVPGHILLQSLRGPSAVVRFTAWEQAFDLLVVLGVLTLWVAAATGHVVAPAASRRVGGRVGRGAMLVGALFAVGTRWVAGLQQGFTWTAGAETGLYQNTGDGFVNTVEVLQGTDVLTVIGLGVFAAGVLLFVAGLALPMADDPAERGRGPVWLLAAGLGALIVGTALPTGATRPITYLGLAAAAVGLVAYFVAPLIDRRRSDSAKRIGGDRLSSFEWPDLEEPRRIRRGAAGVFALAVVAVFALPAFDAGNEATLLADTSRDHAGGSIEAQGRLVYVSEGCWYCHTQQVRAVVTDLGLGPVSVPGDFVFDLPGVLGVARLGPDLTHAGSREPTSDTAWVAAHLADPRAERPWSTMPAYAHLGESDLAALAAYIAALE